MFVLHMQVTLAVICSNIIHITASVPKYQHWDIVSTFMMKYSDIHEERIVTFQRILDYY